MPASKDGGVVGVVELGMPEGIAGVSLAGVEDNDAEGVVAGEHAAMSFFDCSFQHLEHISPVALEPEDEEKSELG